MPSTQSPALLGEHRQQCSANPKAFFSSSEAFLTRKGPSLDTGAPAGSFPQILSQRSQLVSMLWLKEAMLSQRLAMPREAAILVQSPRTSHADWDGPVPFSRWCAPGLQLLPHGLHDTSQPAKRSLQEACRETPEQLTGSPHCSAQSLSSFSLLCACVRAVCVCAHLFNTHTNHVVDPLIRKIILREVLFLSGII